ncbi:uroporphyrinogen decarboxylase [Candidatus Regiella insecticola]|uniref:Uroporphyrinogen decarboxylase n=2 Tax=Candidatus Regiella insecticola TaxID=138073 RepID=A0A6L2ZMX1_9ENTR|nr:uroporphyrinogen decarboxylase [Candidatus Regiella insecticola]
MQQGYNLESHFMNKLENDLYLRALLRQPVDVTPVWMMRQAGRYLPEYQDIRKKAGDFMSLCKNPELACEVTMQPLRRYPLLDAAIVFSDILTIPDAMGLELYFVEGEGPRFGKPITCRADVEKLPNPDPEQELGYVMDAVRRVRHELAGSRPLIGFSGSPWTLAAYMVEGGSSKNNNFTKIKKMMCDDPESLKLLLEKLTKTVTQYLNAQIKAGAQSVMIFDTWGGLLTTEGYQTFSSYYMKEILKVLIGENEGRPVPVTLFTKGGGHWLEEIASTGCAAIGLDWTTDIASARRQVGDKVALQGNMDPHILCAQPERIRQEVGSILAGYGEGSGHVFNLGHGILQDTPPENVDVFVNAVHSFSRQYHQSVTDTLALSGAPLLS